MAIPPLVHAALEAVVTVDHEQRIVMINPAGLTMFRVEKEQVLGRPLSMLIPDRFRARHAKDVQAFQNSGQVERPMGERGNVLGLRSNGEEFPLEAAIFRSEVGAQTYYTALLRDLSEVQSLSVVIEQLNQRLRAVFDRLPVAVWITEGEQVVFSNGAGASLLGYREPAQLIGKTIQELLTPTANDLIQSRVQSLSAGQPVSAFTTTVQHTDGRMHEVTVNAVVLPDHERSLVQWVVQDVTQQSSEKRDLMRSRRTLRALSANMVDAREEERRRIARELHDELGQRLSALKLEMSACLKLPTPHEMPERGEHMLDMLDELVASVRRIATDLRPLMLDDLGLKDSIEWLVQTFTRQHAVAVDTRIDADLGQLSPKLSVALYRIVQETLSNIVRHARATTARITLERRGHEIHLSIQDNGIGFSQTSLRKDSRSFGLMGIQERVQMLGGHLTLGNASGGGARLSIRVPMVYPSLSEQEEEWISVEPALEDDFPGAGGGPKGRGELT